MAYERVPWIRVPPPGPKAQAIIARDRRVNSPSYTRPYPFVMARGKGVAVEDVDGNVYLDFTSGIAVLNTGHGHPAVIEAVREQTSRFLHMAGTDFYYEAMVQLAERLVRLPGEGAWRVFFTNSGTEAVEAALKLARWVTGRTEFIAFYGAFHGRTLGSLSLTASKAIHKHRFPPTVGTVHHVPYPNPYRPWGGGPPERCTDVTLAFIEEFILHRVTHPDNVAAVIVEPIQGEGGYVFPPLDFLPRLRELTNRYGLLLIVDEVQTGIGRTGRWFAYQHTGIQPDMITVAKAIASGLPLGCLLARAELMTWPPGAHANTFGANPLACVAALKTIELVENGLMDRARSMGAYLLRRLQERLASHPMVGRVDGLGLMVGIEFVTDQKSRRPFPALRDEVIYRCFQQGLLLLGCGDSAIRLIPPLVVEEPHIDTAVQILADVVHACTSAMERRRREGR